MYLVGDEDPDKENQLMDIIENRVNKNRMTFASFVGYHALKTLIKKQGYLLKFIHYQRFLSFPVLYFFFWRNSQDMTNKIVDAGLHGYLTRRN